MQRFDRIFTKVCDRLTLYLCGAIVLIMMLYVFANVFFRYVLGLGGVLGCYFFVGTLMVPLIYLSLSFAWYKKGYIVVDILQDRIKGRLLWGFQFAFLMVTLIGFTLVLFYGAIPQTIHTYITTTFIGEPGYQTPEWAWQSTIVLGTLLLAIRNILDMVRMIRTGEIVPMKDRS